MIANVIKKGFIFNKLYNLNRLKYKTDKISEKVDVAIMVSVISKGKNMFNKLNKKSKTIISIFSAKKRRFPMKIDMMEKHPLGSQAFIPMKETTFLAIEDRQCFKKMIMEGVFQ